MIRMVVTHEKYCSICFHLTCSMVKTELIINKKKWKAIYNIYSSKKIWGKAVYDDLS